MSDLRHLTAAFRSFAARMAAIEDCLVIVLRNSEQESDWRHEQRNIEQIRKGDLEELVRATKQSQEFQGALWKYLAKLDERLEALASTRHEDVKKLSQRVRKLEAGDEEVTQA